MCVGLCVCICVSVYVCVCVDIKMSYLSELDTFMDCLCGVIGYLQLKLVDDLRIKATQKTLFSNLCFIDFSR